MIKKSVSIMAFMLIVFGYCAVSHAAQQPELLSASAADCRPAMNVSATANSTGTNKSWISVSTVELEDDMFDCAHHIVCTGTDVAPGTNQFRIHFDSVPEMAIGDFCYLSFYYRVNGAEENEEYTDAPPRFQVAKFGMNSGAAISAQDTSNFHVWKKVSGIVPMETAVTSGSMYVQLSFMKPGEGLGSYCVDIADVNFIYFGVPDGETEIEKELYIQEYLNDSSVSEVTYNSEVIDLEKYPDAFSAKVPWDGEELYEVTGKDAWGRYADVEYSSDKLPMTATVTAYAKNYDFMNPDETLQTQYTVSLSPLKAAYEISADRDIEGWSELTKGDKVTLTSHYFNFDMETKEYIEILQITKVNKVIELFVKKITLDGSETVTDDTFDAELALDDYSGADVRAYIIDMSTLIDVCE